MRTERRPPRIATWLLKGLGCGADNDAVIGDLTEEFLRGRTSGWYWKQTAVVIFASALNDLRRHKFRALGAIAAAYTVMGFIEVLLNRLFIRVVQPALGAWIPAVVWNSEVFAWLYTFAVGATWAFLVASGGGWIGSRLYYRKKAIVLALSLVFGLLWTSGFVLYLHNETFDFLSTAVYSVNLAAGIGGLAAGGLRKQASVHTESVS